MKAILVLSALSLAVISAAQGFNPPSAANVAKAKAALSKAEAEYRKTKVAYKAHPNDRKARDRFVAAATRYGHESMTSDALVPRVKYPQALRIYREVLKVDPKNPVAKPESELIIRIYKSMNRPIPK